MILKAKVLENYPLEQLNTFHLQGKSRFFVSIESEKQLVDIFSDPRFVSLEKRCLGGGSNILFVDDFKGLLFQNNILGLEVLSENEESVQLRVGAGLSWQEFVEKALAENWGGIENLNLIPGRVGAAPIQNIGAYGVEVKSVIESVEVFNPETLKQEILSHQACEFAYRDSVFKSEKGRHWVVTHVRFVLKKKPTLVLDYGIIKEQLRAQGLVSPTIRDVAQVIGEIRRAKLPDPNVIGNAGSFFKNPLVPEELCKELDKKYSPFVSYPEGPSWRKVPAGWLIEKAGLKGHRQGNCGVHTQQALVLVNYGGATGREILALAEYVQDKVYQQFGIQLEREVNVIPQPRKG